MSEFKSVLTPERLEEISNETEFYGIYHREFYKFCDALEKEITSKEKKRMIKSKEILPEAEIIYNLNFAISKFQYDTINKLVEAEIQCPTIRITWGEDRERKVNSLKIEIKWWDMYSQWNKFMTKYVPIDLIRFNNYGYKILESISEEMVKDILIENKRYEGKK